jgi:hypothetical protein
VRNETQSAYFSVPERVLKGLFEAETPPGELPLMHVTLDYGTGEKTAAVIYRRPTA